MEFEDVNKDGANLEVQVSKTVGLSIYIDFNEAIKLAQHGDKEATTLTLKEKSKIRGLNDMMKVIQRKIDYILPVVSEKEKSAWKKKYRKDEEKKENPFEKYSEDLENLELFDNFLISQQKEIDKARISITEKDDYVTNHLGSDGQSNAYVNDKYYTLLSELREINVEIENIMSKNGLRMFKREDENPEKTISEMADDRLAYS